MKLQINLATDKNHDWSKVFFSEKEVDIYTVNVSGWDEEINDWNDDTMLYVCEPGHCENMNGIGIDINDYRNFAFLNNACFKYVLYWYNKEDAMKSVDFLQKKLVEINHDVSFVDYEELMARNREANLKFLSE